jgi:hypothetical protein
MPSGLRLCACLVLLVICMPSCQRTTALAPKSLEGCYDLNMSDWRPQLNLREDNKYITPPTRVQLLLERGSQGDERRGYLLRAAPGEQTDFWAAAGEQFRSHRFSYWLVDGGYVVLVFTNGFSGVGIKMRPTGTTLKGNANTFWDFDRPEQTAEVTARKTGCDK